jgi:hypothetical protein
VWLPPAACRRIAHIEVCPRRNDFFLPVAVLSKVSEVSSWPPSSRPSSRRVAFLRATPSSLSAKLFRSLLRQLFSKRWVVYCKPPFGGPDQVLRYLGAYTIGLPSPTIGWFPGRGQGHLPLARLRSQEQERLMTLPVDEFLRRFLLHVLPLRFVRIRHFGFLSVADAARSCHSANRSWRRPLPQLQPPQSSVASAPVPSWTCPLCGGPMIVLDRLSAVQLRLRSPPPRLPNMMTARTPVPTSRLVLQPSLGVCLSRSLADRSGQIR